MRKKWEGFERHGFKSTGSPVKPPINCNEVNRSSFEKLYPDHIFRYIRLLPGLSNLIRNAMYNSSRTLNYSVLRVSNATFLNSKHVIVEYNRLIRWDRRCDFETVKINERSIEWKYDSDWRDRKEEILMKINAKRVTGVRKSEKTHWRALW